MFIFPCLDVLPTVIKLSSPLPLFLSLSLSLSLPLSLLLSLPLPSISFPLFLVCTPGAEEVECFVSVIT